MRMDVKRTSWRISVGLGVLLSAFLAVAACRGCRGTSDKPSDKQVITVGYIPIAECAHLYVGLTKGYFDEEGIQLDLKPMQG